MANIFSMLRPYQLVAAESIEENKKVIIADAMSMGKCAEVLAHKSIIFKRRGYDRPALIVCPSAVIPHWGDEIRKWFIKGNESKIKTVRTESYDSDLEKAVGADFTIIGYPTLSYYGKDRSKIERLKSLGFDYGVIDEGHNLKNPEAVRSGFAREVFHPMKYLSILSGTPVPNTIVDLYALLNLMDPNSFPISSDNPKAILRDFYSQFRKDPMKIKDFFSKHLIGNVARTNEDYLHRKMPLLNLRNLEINLEGEHAEVYEALYENEDIEAGIKLAQLRAVALDPNLANPAYLPPEFAKRIGSMQSCVYQKMDKEIEKIVDGGGKVLIFSDLKTGVLEYLQGRWSKFKPLIIDGDDDKRKIEGYTSQKDLDKREYILRKFFDDIDRKVLMTTTPMDEGVDITAATYVYHLRAPYTPTVLDQRNARTCRIGKIEKEKVDAYIIKTRLGEIDTVDEGVERLLEDKRKAIDFILYDPLKLTKELLQEMVKGETPSNSDNIRSKMSPNLAITEHIRRFIKHRGFDAIQRNYREYSREAEEFANVYARYWEGNLAGNAANLYGKVVHLLEEKQKLPRKLDIASGPFCLSRKIGEPVTNVDINKYMIQAGKKLEERGVIVPGNIGLEGCFHNLPVEDNAFDFALCSLALHSSKLVVERGDKEIHERELAFREINRVLDDNRYGLFILPESVILDSDLNPFYGGLQKLGFKVLPFSGFYKGPKGTDFKVYLGGIEKIANPCEQQLDFDELVWRMDRRWSGKGESKARKRPGCCYTPKKPKQEFVHEFYLAGTSKTIEESVKESL